MRDSSKSNYWQNGHGKDDFFKQISERVFGVRDRERNLTCVPSEQAMQLSHHRGPTVRNLGREGVQELISNKHTLCRKLCFLLKLWARKKAKGFSNPLADRFLPISVE